MTKKIIFFIIDVREGGRSMYLYWRRKRLNFIVRILVGAMIFNYFNDIYLLIAQATVVASNIEEAQEWNNENSNDESENLNSHNQVTLSNLEVNSDEVTSVEDEVEDTDDHVTSELESSMDGNELSNDNEEASSNLDSNNEETEMLSSEVEDEKISAMGRSQRKGLVQFWQVVPEGQQSTEGTTTSAILNKLQCRPNHDLYPADGVSSHTTYVNSCYVDDALYLGEDNDYYYVYVSGYEGKVAKSKSHYYQLDMNGDGEYVSYEIQTVAYYIPDDGTRMASEDEGISSNELRYADDILDKYSDEQITLRSNWSVQSPSFYRNEGGELIHYISNNVRKANSYSSIVVGPAPSWMTQNIKYYSYDGIYFCNRWQDIQVDGSGAVNKSNPFYNYFQYIPFRSKSVYDASTIEKYTVNNVGGSNSKLLGTGSYFYAVQDKYGINGVLQYAMGIHESGWGKSNLSLNKNNLFGMNATDSNPYGNGTSFPTVEAGINYHADRYLSWGYTDPISDARYFGSHVGNKGSGMNVKYASDPFWGEKIAGWYYKFDKANGSKDYNYYSIGIKQDSTVANIRSLASTSSNILYQTKNKYSNLTVRNYPVIILSQNNDFYQIKTDTPIVNGAAKFNGTYNWDTTNGYITKSVINVINHHNYRNPNQASSVKKGWVEIDGYWSYFDAYGNKVIGWQQIEGVQYYFNSKGQMLKGWQNIDGITYYFNGDGHMLKGFQSIEGSWYYFNYEGHMLKGWQSIEGIWYYFNYEGHMLKGWQSIEGIWYYFNDEGHRMTGWQTINGIKYYFSPEGHRMTGKQKIDGVTYYFSPEGHFQK